MTWSHQLAAFKILLDETLKQSKERPEKGLLLRATALVTVEVQAGASVHSDEGGILQDSYLGILQNGLNQLQASNILTKWPHRKAGHTLQYKAMSHKIQV